MMEQIRIWSSAPLKMMIAGEWSVLHPGNHGIVTALNSRVTVEITESIHKCWCITSTDGRHFSSQLSPEKWANSNPYWKFAFTLLQLANRWYFLSNPLTIRIETPPEASYGLGSSAAVCVALAAAIITAASSAPPSKEEILRLALIAHIQAQEWRGSGSDCAASTYGGTISFRSFDPRYLQTAGHDCELWELLLADIGSSVCSLPEQPFRDMLPFWTGHKESTRRLIHDIESIFRGGAWPALAREGEDIAITLANAITANDAEECLSLARDWFYDLDDLTAGRIVPAKMRCFLDHLNGMGVTAKPSGAGGGDCLVGILPPERRTPSIMKLALSLSPNAEGVIVETGNIRT